MVEEKTVKVKVPGTTANCGPGFDSLGIACNLYNELELTLRKKGKLVIEIMGEGAQNIPCDGRNVVWKSIQYLLHQANLQYQGAYIKSCAAFPRSWQQCCGYCRWSYSRELCNWESVYAPGNFCDGYGYRRTS